MLSVSPTIRPTIPLSHSPSTTKTIFLNDVENWATAVKGENRQALIPQMMETFDKCALAKPGDKVALSFRGKHFTTCPPIPGGVTDLDLSRTPLTLFPEQLPDTLECLNMSECIDVTSMPDDLSVVLPHLTELDISWTSILKLSDTLPDAVTHLNLSHTFIKELPENSLPLLDNLSASECVNLTKVPPGLAGQLPVWKPDGSLNRARQALYQTFMDCSNFSKIILCGTTYKQSLPRSCGAACFLVIAHDLGVKKMPVTASSPLGLNAQCEKVLYKMLSGFEGDVSELTGNEYSYPIHIIQTAKQMGLRAKIYIPTNKYTERLRSNPISANAEAALITAGISINKEIVPPLKEDEIAMKLIICTGSLGNNTQHWIIARPDGSCMDTVYAKNFTAFSQMALFDAKQNGMMEDSSVSIVFRRDLPDTKFTESLTRSI